MILRCIIKNIDFNRPFHVGASFVSLAPTYFISQSALTPLLLLSKPDPQRWAQVWVRRCAAVLFVIERLSILTSPSSASQASYRLRRVFSFQDKTHRALILLLLASNRDPQRWARGWVPPFGRLFPIRPYILYLFHQRSASGSARSAPAGPSGRRTCGRICRYATMEKRGDAAP